MTTKQTSSKAQKGRLHRQVKHALVPHKGNQYRPHIIRWQGLAIVLALLLVVQLVYGVVFNNGGVLGRVSYVDTAQLLTDTNAEREKAGVAPLATNESLNRAAALKAQDMFTHNYWAHTSPAGVSPWKWLSDVAYRYDQAGENLAKNYPNASSTVAAWMGSNAHRANMLNGNFSEVGFAVMDGTIDGRDTTLVVAYYGAPKGTVVQGATDQTPSVFAPPVAQTGSNPLTYFATALLSLTPATIGALAVLFAVAGIGLLAHHYRSKLPKAWRKSWRLHHGLYTFIGFIGVAVLLVLATGGGQI